MKNRKNKKNWKQRLTGIWKNKWFRYSLLSFVLLFIAAELFARFYLGLGSTPVYVESDRYEYIYAPNQDVTRFGNRIQTNKHSMRSKPLSKKDKRRILLIGDSVINGGPHVDQTDLVSTRLEAMADKIFPGTRVLNISAGSWGPDNAFAYIKEHGHFDASAMILVFSSHDYHDNMHFRTVVGEHPRWPDSQPWLALTDGFNRYAWPRIKAFFGSETDEYAYLKGFDDSAINSGWKDFVAYCEKHEIPLVIYHHPEQGEISNAQFNTKGQALKDYLKEFAIQYYSGLAVPHETSEYRDNVHLNAGGHKRLAEILWPHVQSFCRAN